jgi:biopolymer transport protein TolR
VARRGPRRRPTPGFRDVNVTPLVDVMLVLLIVFMITAPLLTTGLPVDLPNVDAEPAPVHDSRLVISVLADERVIFDDRDITGDVTAQLRASPALAEARAIYVRADENVRYRAVARVIAASRAAGIADVNLIVEREVP